MKSWTASLLLLPLAAAGILAAEARAEEPKGPPPALEKLAGLEGHWVGEAKAMLGGKKYALTYHAEFRRTKDGSGVAMTEWFDSAELGAFRGENLIGFDPFSAKVRWFSVDNMGTTHEHVGDWASENRFAMEHRGLREGKRYVETVSLERLGADALAVHIVGRLGGKKVEELTGTFHRTAMQSSR
jgi:hypothetical protein